MDKDENPPHWPPTYHPNVCTFPGTLTCRFSVLRWVRLTRLFSHYFAHGSAWLLPTLFRSAACPSPGETPFSTFSPSPPWFLGCDPRRSRGKAWLQVLDATCNCLPLSCSPQLPYNALQRCAPLSQRIQMGSEALKRGTRKKKEKNRHNPRDSDHLLSRSNGKKKDKTKKLQHEWGRRSSPSSCECLSSRKKTKKKKTYSPNDATGRCGSGGGVWGGEGVWTLAKIMTQSFFVCCCFFLVISLSLSLPGSQSGAPRCLEVRLGLPGFENRVLFVKRAEPAQSE